MLLFKCTHAKHVHLLLCEESPVSATHILLGQTGKEHAVKLEHLVAEALKDAAHDAVAARVDLDAHLLTPSWPHTRARLRIHR